MDAVLPVVIVLLISLFLAFYFRHSKKTDRGFQFFYYKLSYRRRFLRSLYLSPLVVILWGLVMFRTSVWSQTTKVLWTIFIATVFLFEIGYNYIKWKKEESI